MTVYERDLRGGHAPDSSKMYDVAGDLGIFLSIWETRHNAEPGTSPRGAANTAMEAIDRGIATLHNLRARLVGEMRDYDDATAARVDALLAQGGEPQ